MPDCSAVLLLINNNNIKSFDRNIYKYIRLNFIIIINMILIMRMTDIKKGNIKITVFDEFPMSEMIKINKELENLGYNGSIISNGNIVYQKTEEKSIINFNVDGSFSIKCKHCNKTNAFLRHNLDSNFLRCKSCGGVIHVNK